MSENFVWSSLEGFALARRIVTLTGQLEGVCKSLDGVSLFAITLIGSGNFYILIGYSMLYIPIILEVFEDPDLCPSADFPKNPVLPVICPTIPLQIEMTGGVLTLDFSSLQALNMVKLGLKAIVINCETKTVAQQEDKEL
ncbi:hypothetical protein K438DRAFT_2042042 [Mycena galopus ATCC 62051]|nr:hypothetical protein K438DRAFT_2042042 [Mycena galopus ATCC 62051]